MSVVNDAVIKEFVKNISEDEIRFLGMRITERLQDDLAEVFNFISKSNARNIGIDEMFRSSSSAEDLYDCCDAFEKYLTREADKKKISLVRGKR